ncbi:hypothetical protein QR680_009352 [Steinernema hermaphroditum]|uniref:Uncharacterized protein n=1 Tax=Steinernema hermaphroditum TaxID=289476 RepID=A0AA39IK01_9BILA|nr:hypothetical protein QR680_009352 [Steinernema hermaphroditum]
METWMFWMFRSSCFRDRRQTTPNTFVGPRTMLTQKVQDGKCLPPIPTEVETETKIYISTPPCQLCLDF